MMKRGKENTEIESRQFRFLHGGGEAVISVSSLNVHPQSTLLRRLPIQFLTVGRHSQGLLRPINSNTGRRSRTQNKRQHPKIVSCRDSDKGEAVCFGGCIR